MLRTALGPAIARFLEDPSIVEVMLNPDGRVWIDRFDQGLVAADARQGVSFEEIHQQAMAGKYAPAEAPVEVPDAS